MYIKPETIKETGFISKEEFLSLVKAVNTLNEAVTALNNEILCSEQAYIAADLREVTYRLDKLGLDNE